jgi:hypothetical protein
VLFHNDITFFIKCQSRQNKWPSDNESGVCKIHLTSVRNTVVFSTHAFVTASHFYSRLAKGLIGVNYKGALPGSLTNIKTRKKTLPKTHQLTIKSALVQNSTGNAPGETFYQNGVG